MSKFSFYLKTSWRCPASRQQLAFVSFVVNFYCLFTHFYSKNAGSVLNLICIFLNKLFKITKLPTKTNFLKFICIIEDDVTVAWVKKMFETDFCLIFIQQLFTTITYLSNSKFVLLTLTVLLTLLLSSP